MRLVWFILIGIVIVLAVSQGIQSLTFKLKANTNISPSASYSLVATNSDELSLSYMLVTKMVKPNREITNHDVIGSTKEESLPNMVPEVSLFEFDGRNPSWFPVNDNVMGGLSSGLVKVEPEMRRLSFYGNLSLENNGGFASIRSEYTTYDLSTYDGIVLKVRGDGKKYRFRIRTEETGPDVAYTAYFETEDNVWQDVYVPFSEMVPTYRGVIVEGLDPLNPSSIRSFGFMIADKQQGDFMLEVEAISSVANIAAAAAGTSG